MNRLVLNHWAALTRKGDEEAFAKLYEETKKGVFSYVYSIVHNYHAAEELMQDVYVKVKLSISSFRDDTNFSAWLLEIAKNLSYNYISKRKREVLCDIPDTYASQEHSQIGEMTDIVNKVLNKEEGQIVLLHAVAGYKHREIAELLGKPVGTVTWTYKNAIQKLREYMEKEGV